MVKKPLISLSQAPIVISDLNLVCANKHHTFSYSESNAFAKCRWNQECQDLTEESFKEESIALTDFLKNKRPRFLLLNTTDFFYEIPTSLQLWYSSRLGEEWHELHLKKIGLVTNSNLLVNISVEAIGHYAYGQGFKMGAFRFFDDEDSACRWMLQ